MTKFKIRKETQKLLNSLGLKYQYSYKNGREGQIHQNQFCLLDGTVVLEAGILEQDGKGTISIIDSHRKRDYSFSDVNHLNLLIINIGDTFSPKVPFIFIRILDGLCLLHHSEYKQ
jgi:hypothetical protein